MNIFLSLGLEMEDLNYESILIDIDTPIPKTDSRNVSKDLV